MHAQCINVVVYAARCRYRRPRPPRQRPVRHWRAVRLRRAGRPILRQAVPNGTPGPATATLGATAAKMPTTHLLIFILTLRFETSVAPFTNSRSFAHSANFGELSRAQFPCRKRLSVVNQVQSSGRTGASPGRRKIFRQFRTSQPGRHVANGIPRRSLSGTRSVRYRVSMDTSFASLRAHRATHCGRTR